MKLSADILYWQLKEQLTTVTLQGQCGSALTLTRPEFYLDRSQSFEKDRVYVCSADHLPQRPSLGENVCLVCLGQHWNLTAYYHRCSVILVEGDWDIFRTFNLVQHIFDQYDSWEERLWTILRHGAVLQQMLDAFIGDRPTVARVQPEQDMLDDVVMKMILGEIARMKPADIDSKEAKLRLIKRLNDKGIFGARGAVGTVCELLHIAQPTLYKYLQEIKEE